MKVRLLTVSHKQPAWVLEGCADYQRRLPREWGFQLVEVKPEARTAAATKERVHAAEAKRVREAVPKGSLVVALDERGERWSTLDLARRLQLWQREGRDVAFIVGGADGLDPEFLAGAALRVSLSGMTLPHGLVRILVVEQLYRAASMLLGHPYHK